MTALASASTAAIPSFPAFYAIGDQPSLGGSVNLDLDAEYLDQAGDSERLTMLVPAAFGVDLAHPANQSVGQSQVFALANGKEVHFVGSLLAMAKSAYSANADAQACSPGAHAAYWKMQMKSASGAPLTIPIAVDRGGQGTTFTMCFDAQRAAGLEMRQVEFLAKRVFATPTHAGKFLIDSIVTPFADDGTPDASSAYELRAYEDLPSSLSAHAVYHTATREFTVSGALKIGGGGKARVDVEIFVSSSLYGTAQQIGTVLSGAGGKYTFTRRLASPPKSMYTDAVPGSFSVCSGTSSAPAGCASYSLDGVGSPWVLVTVTP